MKRNRENKQKIVQITGSDFRKMQLLELDMLAEFDKVCRNNNIKYTIFGGTLLGAIRHKGYIPWDDDADIAMLREEYEKFKLVANQMNDKICFFQDNSTDENYRWGYGKLRRTGTTFIRCGQSHLKSKTGVFVDIFPMDDVPKTLIGQILVDFRFFFLRKVLWSEVGKITAKSSFARFIYRCLSSINPKRIFRKLSKKAKRSSNTSPNRVRCLLFPSTGKLYKKNPIKQRYSMPKEWFTDLKEYSFEGKMLFGTKDYDQILAYIYGDYMKLPSEDDRDPHSPVEYYDFGNL